MRMEFTVGMGRDESALDIAKLARTAEDAGFANLTFVDQPNMSRDVFVCMTIAALNTSRIRIGQGVTDPFTYHPSVTANATATVGELSGGRAFVGLGAGGPWGKAMKARPLQELRECIEFIKAYTRGKDAEFRGATMHSEWVGKPLKVYLGGYGPKLCQLAGELADGMMLASNADPVHIKWQLEQIEKGAAKVGRDPSEIDVWARGMIYVADSKDQAKKEVSGYAVNSASALWTRDKRSITNEQYKEFYHHVGMAYDDPWMTMHNKAEGLISFTNLLFIPSNRPFDIFNPDRKSNLKLYVKRVFITDDCEGLIPPYLRFVKGIIDTDDIDLNISREMLQNNPVVAKIKNAIIKRVVSELKKKAENDKDEYKKFWDAFGPVLKEGIHEDFTNRNKLLEISRFQSTNSDQLTSLEEYVSRMQKGQNSIYYISGEDKDKLSQSPHLEGFKAKGVEVLFMTDPVDEFWLPSVGNYSEKSFQSVTRGAADLDKIKSKGEDKDKDKDKNKKQNIDKLIASLKVVLGKEVKDIKSSERLTDSAVCLVAGEGEMDMHLEKLLKQHQQLDSTSQKVLEINPAHPLIANLLNILDNEQKKAEIFDDAAWLLLDQARIIEGQSVSDPNKFSRRMNALIQKGIAL